MIGERIRIFLPAYKKGIELNRKVLAEIAQSKPIHFQILVDKVKYIPSLPFISGVPYFFMASLLNASGVG